MGSCLCARGLINGILLGKTRLPVEQRRERGKGGENTSGCCCCGRNASTSETDLLVSPQGLEGKQKQWLKISSRHSCAFTLPVLTSVHPTAVSSSGGVGRPLVKRPGVESTLFSSPRLPLVLTPCLQPDVLPACLLPALAFTLVVIQQFSSGSRSS